MLNGNVTDDNSSTPPPSGSEGSTAASRPVRAVVANAAAISVAQQDMNHSGGGTTSGPKNRGRQKKASESPVLPPPIVPGSVAGRKKFGKGPAISSSAALDLLHKATMDSIHSKFHRTNIENINTNVTFCSMLLVLNLFILELLTSQNII